MNLSQITAKYLKGQKKHTIMSVIAITVSVAFMTVLLCALSVYRASSLNIAKNKNGTYHIVFNTLNKEQLLSIRNMDIFSETEIYGVSSYLSTVNLDMDKMKELDATQEYLVRQGNLVNDVFLRMDADKVTMLPDAMKTCTEGRMPTADGEIVIANSSAYMWGYPQIGQTVTATVVSCKYKEGNGIESDLVPQILSDTFDITNAVEVSFTVTGFTEKSNVVCYNDTRLRSSTTSYDHLLARFSDDANDYYFDMDKAFHNVGLEIDDFDYGMNQELLNAENRGVKAHFSTALFFAVMYLFLLFIMFCARLVIDDSFEISAKERIKQFGLLKAVGASRKQIFKMLCIEAGMLAAPGVAAGLVLGLALAYLIFSLLRGIVLSSSLDLGYDLAEMLSFDIRAYVFVTAIILGFLWVLVSAVATGMRSIRSTPVEALHAARHSEKIKVPKKPSSMERGGSFIGAYSSLSIKRNTKRYVITIVSMVLSIVMFTGFSYILELLKEKIDIDYAPEKAPHDYIINYVGYYPYEALAFQNDLIDSGLFKNAQCYTTIALYNDDISAFGANDSGDYGVMNIAPVTKETFDSFIKPNVSITYEELNEKNAMLICSARFDEEGNYNGELFTQAPDKITGTPFAANLMHFFENDMTVNVAGLYATDNVVYQSSGTRIAAVMTEPAFYAIFDSLDQRDTYTFAEIEDNKIVDYYYQRSLFADSTGNLEEERLYLNRNFYEKYTDVAGQRANRTAILNMAALLGYFIIGIIALIAVINIVNIISANVLNRTSELSMLRACGMSDKQLHKLLFVESIKYAGIAGIISLILTEAIIFITRMPFTYQIHDLYFEDIGVEFSFLPPLKYLCIAVLFAFAVAALASYFPARRTIKQSIVENIRNMES